MRKNLKRRHSQGIILLICGILGVFFGASHSRWQQEQSVQASQPVWSQPVSKVGQIDLVVSKTSKISKTSETSEVRYVVRKRDTLTKIARIFCDDISAIAKRNSIRNPNRIFAGATITVVKNVGCASSEQQKKYVSPEKFAVSSGRASQEKRLTYPESRKLASTHHTRKQGYNSISSIRSRYGKSIRRASVESDLSEQLILAVIIVESNGNARAISPTGCRGLMQLLTSTAAQYGVPRSRIFDPDANIRGGARVLADYLHRYAHGDLDRALASYNRGPNAVSRLMRDKGFNPSSYPYVVRVKKVLRLLELKQER